jgi:hypothetical protein
VFFIGLVIAITAAISGSAAFFSIYGLAQTFAVKFYYVVVMGAALEAGKLVTASYLYKYWTKIGFFFKTYLTAAVLGLMVLTSLGVFGFLSAAHQSDTIDLKTGTQRIESIHRQQENLQARLVNIDDQIKHIPDGQVRKKLQLIKASKDEKATILKSLDSINVEEQQLSAKKLQNEAQVGPVVFISQALGKTVDQTTIYIICLIVSVFDPLAVALTIAINLMLKERAKKNEVQQTALETAAKQTRSEIIKSIRKFDN